MLTTLILLHVPEDNFNTKAEQIGKQIKPELDGATYIPMKTSGIPESTNYAHAIRDYLGVRTYVSSPDFLTTAKLGENFWYTDFTQNKIDDLENYLDKKIETSQAIILLEGKSIDVLMKHYTKQKRFDTPQPKTKPGEGFLINYNESNKYKYLQLPEEK